MKKKVIAAVLIGLAAGVVIWRGLSGPLNVNGDPVYGVKNISEAGEVYLEQYSDRYRLLDDDNAEKTYIHTDCTIHTSLPLFLARLTGIKLIPDITYSGAGNISVEDALKKAADQYNEEYGTEAGNASLYKKDGSRLYSVRPAVTGTHMDSGKLISAYREGQTDIAFSPDEVLPDISTEDMRKAAKKANKVLKWKVSYTKDYTIQLPEECVAVSGTTVTISDYDFSEELKHLDLLYSTQGHKHSAVLHNGKTYTSDKGTWKELTDSAKERSFLLKALKQRKSHSNRKPYMKAVNPELIIEVSKANQHVWAYKPDGKAVMDSACVTGQKRKHDTPTGIFYISQISKDYDMHGDGYVSHCQRFMRITNTGIALHDASWRSRFGGNIYTYSGSHGCINLPTAFALRLSGIVKAGNTMVIVH